MPRTVNSILLDQFIDTLPTIRTVPYTENRITVGDRVLLISPDFSKCKRVFAIVLVAIASILLLTVPFLIYFGTYRKIAKYILELRLGGAIQKKEEHVQLLIDFLQKIKWHNNTYEECLQALLADVKAGKDIDYFFKLGITIFDIDKLSKAQILALNPAALFTIIPLIRQPIALQIINDPTVDPSIKRGIYLFNQFYSNKNISKLTKVITHPAFDPEIQELANQASLSVSQTTRLKEDEIKFRGSLDKEISECFLLELNDAILADRTKDKKFRSLRSDAQFDIGVMDYPAGISIEGKEGVRKFIEWFNSNLKQIVHPVIFAAQVYMHIASIRPLQFANGKTGRYLANMVLKKYKCLPSKLDKSVYKYFIVKPNTQPAEVAKAIGIFAQGILDNAISLQ